MFMHANQNGASLFVSVYCDNRDVYEYGLVMESRHKDGRERKRKERDRGKGRRKRIEREEE